jgi:hypothetical protein
MPYTKTSWADRLVQYPSRFTRTSDGTYDTLTPSPGTVTTPGTPLTASALNNMETQYDNAVADAVSQVTTIPNWTVATLVNSWAQYGGSYAYAAYTKQPNGLVLLRGAVKSGTTGTIMFNLPTGYRPQYDAAFASVDGNNNHCTVVARADGTVVLLASTGYTVNTAFISLDVVRFQTKSS